MRGHFTTRRLALSAALLLTLVLTACGGSTAAPSANKPAPTNTTQTQAAPPAPAAADTSCGDATASLRPEGPLASPGNMPSGSYMKHIQDRGRIVVGVAQDTLLFGYLNPLSNQLEGFDIDMVKQISKSIFGDENHIQYKVITSAERIPMLQSGEIDLVAHTMTINCARWKQVSFSSVYFEAGQRVLVDRSSPAKSIDDLGGKKVCAASGSTSIANIAAAKSHPIPVEVSDWTDCLVRFQLPASDPAHVDAISTDDVILYGLAAQDPYAKVIGPKFTAEPYGLAMNQDHPEFVRFVNGVLEQMRQDGQWKAGCQKWMGKFSDCAVPQATYKN